eukprot:scaffold99557_cov33-Tisochrysis_lutea.AAC.3
MDGRYTSPPREPLPSPVSFSPRRAKTGEKKKEARGKPPAGEGRRFPPFPSPPRAASFAPAHTHTHALKLMSAVPASLTPADAGAVNDQRLPRARRPARRANPVEGRGRPRAGVNGGQILPPGPRGLPPARWRRQEQECPISLTEHLDLRIPCLLPPPAPASCSCASALPLPLPLPRLDA